MCRLIKRIAPVLFALSTLSQVSLATPPPFGVRGVEIVILVGPSETSEASRAIGLLSDALQARSFTVVQKPDEDPRVHLDHNPKVSHVVAGIRSDEGKLMAWVYTQGVESPRAIRASSADNLKSAIVEYLESPEMQRARIEARKRRSPGETPESDADFSNRLDRGLEFVYAAERPGRAAADSVADYQRALAEFNRALAINPRSAIAHYNLAYCYKRIGDRERYRDHVDRGLKCDPENTALRNEKALLAIADGRSDEGITILRGLPQDSPLYQLNLAWAYAQTNRPELAKGILKSIRMQDADPSLVEVADRRLRDLEEKEKKLQVVDAKLNWRTLALWAVACVAFVGIAASGAYYVRVIKEHPKESQLEFKRNTIVTIIGALCSLMTAMFGLLFK
jgi:tetratricopeptide (TPR) repeat protein